MILIGAINGKLVQNSVSYTQPGDDSTWKTSYPAGQRRPFSRPGSNLGFGSRVETQTETREAHHQLTVTSLAKALPYSQTQQERAISRDA